MNTDQLIAALAAQAGAVDPRLPVRRLAIAAAAGALAALPLTIWLLGINPEIAADVRTPMFWVKLGFVAAVAAASWHWLRRLAQPGASSRRAAQAVAVPIVALWLLALAVLGLAPAGERAALVLGTSWLACPFSIALVSLPALVITLAAARSLAPTRLTQAGAAAGLLAGALGALAYLLHCPELEAPFIAIWYVLGMLIPAIAGAALGRAVLRW